MAALFVGIPQDDDVLFVNLGTVCYANYAEGPDKTKLVLTFPDGFKVEVFGEQADEITRLFSEFKQS